MTNEIIGKPAIRPVVGSPSRILSFDGSPPRDEDRDIAVETPVQVVYSDIPFAVMMLTPADLIDFAYGFSLTEGMIAAAGDIRHVAVDHSDDTGAEDGLILRIGLKGEKLQKHLARQRAMTGRTGCGVCGIDDLAALRRATAPRIVPSPISVASIEHALSSLDLRQTLNVKTRAVHAAAWADHDGQLIYVREDVGRHNALDKLIGTLLRKSIDPAGGFIVITSRCSFEMVEKAATFGASSLVSISAPTSLAIERARTLDVTLIGIARHDTITVFHGVGHVIAKSETGS